MAARKKTGKSKKIPAVRYLRYELTNSGSANTETSHFIDLARDLSAINRRLYRQGRDYHIRKVTVTSINTPNGGGRISLSTVPDSWTARNAWKRGFETWRKQRKEASDASGIKPGKFDDFKVHLSVDGKGATKLLPKDNGGNSVTLGEWQYAVLHSPDGTTSADDMTLHMLGAHNGSAGSWNSIGLIQSYGETRTTVDTGTPNVPATASDDPLVNMFDHGTNFDEVINEIEQDNDEPPYSVTDYAGDNTNMPKPLVCQTGAFVDGRVVLGGFNAICGLLEIEAQSAIGNDVYEVLVELAPGNYRGISADVI